MWVAFRKGGRAVVVEGRRPKVPQSASENDFSTANLSLVLRSECEIGRANICGLLGRYPQSRRVRTLTPRIVSLRLIKSVERVRCFIVAKCILCRVWQPFLGHYWSLCQRRNWLIT